MKQKYTKLYFVDLAIRYSEHAVKHWKMAAHVLGIFENFKGLTYMYVLCSLTASWSSLISLQTFRHEMCLVNLSSWEIVTFRTNVSFSSVEKFLDLFHHGIALFFFLFPFRVQCLLRNIQSHRDIIAVCNHTNVSIAFTQAPSRLQHEN